MTDVVVLDASIAAGWFFPSQRSAVTDVAFALMETGSAVVPVLRPLEVANLLRQAQRRKLANRESVGSFLTLLAGLPIRVDHEAANVASAFDEIMKLSDRFDLTTYDAAYLELALRSNLPLASRDAVLLKAAKALKLPTLA